MGWYIIPQSTVPKLSFPSINNEEENTVLSVNRMEKKIVRVVTFLSLQLVTWGYIFHIFVHKKKSKKIDLNMSSEERKINIIWNTIWFESWTKQWWSLVQLWKLKTERIEIKAYHSWKLVAQPPAFFKLLSVKNNFQSSHFCQSKHCKQKKDAPTVTEGLLENNGFKLAAKL